MPPRKGNLRATFFGGEAPSIPRGLVASLSIVPVAPPRGIFQAVRSDSDPSDSNRPPAIVELEPKSNGVPLRRSATRLASPICIARPVSSMPPTLGDNVEVTQSARTSTSSGRSLPSRMPRGTSRRKLR